MDRIVQEVLRQDTLLRKLSEMPTDTDLYCFEDLKPNEWDYSLPTLASGDSNKLVQSMKVFKDNFWKSLPFKIQMSNLIFAGGSVSSILCGKTNFSDLDIFVYGLSVAEATTRLKCTVKDLHDAYRKYLSKKQKGNKSTTTTTSAPKIVPSYDFRCIRNKSCVSLIFDDKYTVQIILRVYQSINEVLRGFDLGSSAVGFDGERLYLTELSKFAHEYSCNIIDTTRRSTTYESRLVKYYGRKFDIIVPHLEVSKIRNVNSQYSMQDICVLPHMVFSYEGIRGHRIEVSKFLFPFNTDEGDYQIENLDENRIFYINLNNLVHGKADYYYFTTNAKKTLRDKPYMSRRRVINYYDDMLTKLTTEPTLNIKMLRRYIRDTRDLLQTLVDGSEADFKVKLTTVISGEKERVLALINDVLTQEYPLQWVTQNPGTQLTSSFNPIIEDAKLWYGDLYTELIPVSTPAPKLKSTEQNEDVSESEDEECENDNECSDNNDSDNDCCKKIKKAKKKTVIKKIAINDSDDENDQRYD
jgi:hypothetical protein